MNMRLRFRMIFITIIVVISDLDCVKHATYPFSLFKEVGGSRD